MTRVDFYILGDSEATNRLIFSCKLAEKAFRQNQTVFVYSADRSLLRALDDHLWQFRPLSFVAHQLLDGVTEPTQFPEPVLLSCDQPVGDYQILLNLDMEVPPFFSRFERTLEVVNKDPEIQTAGRERYRFYQQRGYPLKHHAV